MESSINGDNNGGRLAFREWLKAERDGNNLKRHDLNYAYDNKDLPTTVTYRFNGDPKNIQAFVKYVQAVDKNPN